MNVRVCRLSEFHFKKMGVFTLVSVLRYCTEFPHVGDDTNPLDRSCFPTYNVGINPTA